MKKSVNMEQSVMRGGGVHQNGFAHCDTPHWGVPSGGLMKTFHQYVIHTPLYATHVHVDGWYLGLHAHSILFHRMTIYNIATMFIDARH